ncbi:MAG: tyrosine-type recombinase/integrase, partial [Deltaproteobacteria bacterium]|nr:tyrosine-type recombinase/integrase [Deltaproteobacteria bacterium]
ARDHDPRRQRAQGSPHHVARFPSKLSVDPRSQQTRRHHLDSRALQKAVKAAVQRAGVVKHATCHTFRHPP